MGLSFLLYQLRLICVTIENIKLFFEILTEGKVKSVTGNLCLIRSIFFSGFDPEKSSFHLIADNSNEFLSFFHNIESFISHVVYCSI